MYCGVVPRVQNSGKQIKTTVSEKVNKKLKEYFFMAALSAVRTKEGKLAKKYEKLIEKGKPKKIALMKIAKNIASQVYHILKFEI